MTRPAPLQRFVADELARMPPLIEQVCRRTVTALRKAADASSAERTLRFDIAKALEQHAQRWCEAFVSALAGRVQGEIAPPEAGPAALAGAPRGLSLLDEAVHHADVEIARTAALISSAAEWELRELQTFTSALCGLPYVSVNSNPLQPEAFAHALWQAIDTLPQARTHPLLLRSAAGPLAEALRVAFAAACTRLESQGVQPSLYRTAVPAQADRASMLSDLLDSAPQATSARPEATQCATAPDDATTDLLKSLFDAIAKSSRMHPALGTLTGSLQVLALDLVRRDASLLDDAGHPLWQLLDRCAFQSATHPHTADPQMLAWAGFAVELVAQLGAAPLRGSHHFRNSVEQLDAYAAAQFNAQVQQAAADIDALQRDDPGAPPMSIASMDTVPADLLAGAAATEADAPAVAWLLQQAPGGWYRLFLRGRWTVLRLLWRSDAPARWLFASPYPQRNDAFDRASLVRLRAEALIRPFVERALVVRAAESVRRRLSDRRSPR